MTDNLWQVQIFLQQGLNITLLYKSENAARKVLDSDGAESVVEFRDHFGTVVTLSDEKLEDAVIIVQDMKMVLEGGVQRGLLQNDAQMRANRAAGASNGLVAGGIMPAGPFMPRA